MRKSCRHQHQASRSMREIIKSQYLGLFRKYLRRSDCRLQLRAWVRRAAGPLISRQSHPHQGRASDRSLLGTMTRYTNVGWKRAYHQASFDRNNDQITRSTPSTPVPGPSDAAATSHTQSESIIQVDSPAEPKRKRRRKSKVDSEGNVAVDSTPADIANDEDKMSPLVAKKQGTKVLVGRPKLKTKEKTRRSKSA
jgi:hypothetical protein